MSPAKHNSTALFSFVTAFVALLSAQPTHAQDSWMDRPLVNWNRSPGALPQLPQPSSSQVESSNADRCSQQVRQPATTEEKALALRGWRLYGPAYARDATRIVTALSGFDGMCRPIGHQAFVYWEGRYAGTLSPVPMNSRTDGSLTVVHLNSPTSFSAEFVRYKESDPLCCPSRVASVVYSLRRDDIPMLAPENVTHAATPQSGDSAKSGSDGDASRLFGTRWVLTEMDDRKVSADQPNIEFDRDQKRTSGSSGCNRFTGAFERDGSRLKLSHIAGTRRACLDAGVQSAETRFLKALEMTTRFELRGNTLRLFANDAVVLVFTGR